MSKRRKRYAKSEFRYNYNTRHMNYIFEEDGNKYHSLGLTYQRRTLDENNKLHKNMPLLYNPQRNRTKKSYIRYGVISQNKKTFGNIDRRFAFSYHDFPKVKSKIRNYKKNRKKRT